MTDEIEKPHRRRPVPIVEPSPTVKDAERKPRRRYTLEEVLSGMKPERSEFMENDWPMGKELI